MSIILAESLCNGYELKDIARKFAAWRFEGYWTPFGEAFDIGGTTNRAITRLKKGVNPEEAGDKDENCNGNGSLMRILPIAFYLKDAGINRIFSTVHEVSSMTHAHPRSLVTCGIYIQVAVNILNGSDPGTACNDMKKTILNFYKHDPYLGELPRFSRVLEDDISRLPEEEISSDGYVVHTLESGLWCLLNGNTYKETVLSAVNLGWDTDTTGAVAGGLAGIYYGFNSIPGIWIEQIAKKEEITALAGRLFDKIYGK